MTKLVSSRAVVGVLFALFCLTTVSAEAAVTSFVSGKGTDTGNCSSPASPCRTFQYAHNQTVPGGEIKALDPANYSPATINRSVTITGVEGAGILRFTAGDAITISAGPTDRILLRDLSLDGFGVATNGIKVNSAGSVEIVNCVVRRFTSDGIQAAPSSGTLKLFSTDVLASDNGNVGIHVHPSGSATVAGLVKRATLNNNSDGVTLNGLDTTGRIDVTVVDSTAAGNSSVAFRARSNTGTANSTLLLDHVAASGNLFGLTTTERSVVRITRSDFTRNTTGVIVGSFSTVETFGDNVIRGNTTEISGTLFPVAKQ